MSSVGQTAGTGNSGAITSAHHRIGLNVFSNWLSYGSGLIISFLLAPFLVHRLGDAEYGIWALALQAGAYLSLLDLGIRIAVTRYLTFHSTRGDRDRVNKVISVALFSLSGLGLVCIAAGSIVAYHIPTWAHVPQQLIYDTRWTVFLVALSVAVTFPGALFSGALASLSRYDLLNLRTIATMALQAVLFWCAIVAGHGLVALALIMLITKTVGYAFEFWQSWRLYHGFAFGLYRRNFRDTLLTLLSFSVFAFLLSIASRLILWSDNLVVAFVLGPAAVTFYAIAGNLVDNGRSIMSSITSVFVPLATSYDAQGNKQKLQQLLIEGSRATLLVIYPIAVGFFVLGSSFISLWMGPKYAKESTAVLIVLAVPLLFNPMQSTCNQILYAINKHRYYSLMIVLEAILNLALSIVLARKIGILGVAWGTLIPELLIGACVVPAYTARKLQASLARYYWRSWGSVLAAALPYLFAILVFRWAGVPSSWTGFTASVAGSLIVYGVSIWQFSLSRTERARVIERAGKVRQRIFPGYAARAARA